MGMQTQIYLTDEDSLKAHDAWGKCLKAIGKESSQYNLTDFIKDVFFSVIDDKEKFEVFLETKNKENKK